MTAPRLIGVLVVGLIVTSAASAVAVGPTYQRFVREPHHNDCGASGTNHNSPCCAVDGWDTTFDEVNHPHCPTTYDIGIETYSCNTDGRVGVRPGAVAAMCCGCGPVNASTCLFGGDPSQFLDHAINTSNYQCNSSQTPSEPEQCDGLPNSLTFGTAPADKGCGDDENGCKIGDSDPAPVRYSSGRVESNPITVFQAPAPAGVFFGYLLKYNSQVMRTPAQRNTVAGVHDDHPVIHQGEEDTHFVGIGWLDNFSDRLYITPYDATTGSTSPLITWASQNGTVTFVNSNGAWKSWSGTYELIDRGAAASDGLGRWMVRTIAPSAPRQIWSFEEVSYVPYEGTAPQRLGRLRRHAVLGANLDDLAGRYGFTVTWTGLGTIASVIDTLGRALEFDYHLERECMAHDTGIPPPRDDCVRYETTSSRVGAVRYRPSSQAGSIVVANLASTAADPLSSTTPNDRLERIERPGLAGYTRFLYTQVSPANSCVHCVAMLTDVIVPGDQATATPVPLAPVLVTEVVLEHDDYGASVTPNVLVAVHSKAPGREYAYEYTLTQATQFDLDQDGGPCGANNSCTIPGYACHAVNQLAPHCYVADIITHDLNTGLAKTHTSASAGSPVSSPGNPMAFSRHYTTTGRPHDVSDASGQITSYGYDSFARLRCIVYGDSDTQAFADAANPDTSACAGPASAKVVQVDYGATTVTTTTPGALGGSVTTVNTLDPATLLRTASTITGVTKDIDGVAHAETHTTQTSYDALGRVVREDGPLDGAVADDTVETAYYTAPDSASPFDLGQIRTVTRFVGTAATHTPLTTTYGEYDLFGIPHRIVEPGGGELRYTASPDRLEWTIHATGSDGATTLVATIQLNADGSVRSQQDATGVCVTYEYGDASGYVGAPTVIRRASTSCGVLPIDRETGEVEIRTYVNGERDRPQSITRKTNGVVELSYTGFTYDRSRRLTASATRDSAQPFTYGYSDVLLSSVTAPEGPAPGSWKTTITADQLGRPSQISRFIDATNTQTYGYGYASAWASTPTSMTRGFNGSATAVTTLSYDDFGRLLEVTSPEVGRPTRYAYDIADRMIRRRDGVGAPEVTTTAYSYDSLGRVTYVAHAIERPTTCSDSTTPAGTPIQDEEYAYDRCAPEDHPDGVDCDNALGRRTLSRSIEQCGTHGDVIKRGRWYSYDSLGRVTQVAYATVTGAGISAPAVMTYSYDAAGRLQAYSSPVDDAFGTRYAYGANDGRIASLATTAEPASPIAHDFTYRAFGELVHYVTASTQLVTDGARTLSVTNAYRSDDALIGLARSFIGDGATPSVDLVQQTLSYTAAGLLRERGDTADAASSRHYEFDALQRLTCEVRAGTATDCAAGSSKLAALFTYGNGQSAGAPADARLSAMIAAPGGSYISAAAEPYGYTGGAGRPLSISRGDGNIVIGYDGLGRRTFDAQAVPSPSGKILSRRDYSYLPNGQLGQIQGFTPTGEPYTVAIRYDAEGRPSTIAYSAGDTYELFWDDLNRLIAASIDGAHHVRWSYHYAGPLLVAATREVVAGSTEVKRFWPVTDERGLIFRMVDEDGATYWQAHWDATGWRAIDGAPQPDLWVPFGLAGQIILDGTEASPGAGATSVRPAIALNQLRAYDPLFGGFLQPDPEDQSARLLPEGYLLARGDYLGHEDATGAKTSIRDTYAPWIPPGWELRFDASCADRQKAMQAAINQAIADIDKCNLNNCGAGAFAVNLKKQWIFALLTGINYCVSPGGSVAVPTMARGALLKADKNGKILGKFKYRGDAVTFMNYPGVSLGGRLSVFGSSTPCLKQTLAHEAMHGVLSTFPMSEISDSAEVPPEWGVGKLLYGVVGDWTWNEGGQIDEDDRMRPYLDECVNCANK